MRRVSRWILGALLLVLAPGLQATQPREYVGKVDHVYDGRTVRIFYRGGQIRVRLPGIESPNPQQAKQALTKMVAGKTARVREVRWDDGYLIGYLSVDDKDVGTELVRAGYARTARGYRPGADLKWAQDEARAAELGIWAQR